MHAWGAIREIPRVPDLDEIESLQAGVRIARGERIYKDFAEHHSPFVFAFLSTFAPDRSGDAAIRYLHRARLLFALFGVVTLASIAAIVWRASRRLPAVILTLAILFIHPGMWQRSFIDVRVDPPSLAMWWLGCACVVLPPIGGRWSAVLRGVGVGLIVHACLWNPKWPIASVLMGVVFLFTLRRSNAIAGLLSAAIVGGSAFALFALICNWRLAVGNIFGVTRELVKFADEMQAMHVALGYGFPAPWGYCPTMFHPRFVLPAAAVVGFAVVRIARAFADRRLVLILLGILLAALGEIRFLFPYPTAWIQYYILWATTATAIYGLATQAFVAIVASISLASVRLSEAATAIVIVLAFVMGISRIPFGESSANPYWVSFE